MSPVRRHEAFAPALVLAVGVLAIAAAWGFELIGGYIPCKLCLEQRIPYYIGLPVAAVALLAALSGAKPTASRMLLLMTALIFAFGFYLGVRHAGIEWDWWEGPADCGGTAAPTTSAGDLLGQLNTVRVVSCSEASWRMLFLSFAGWNAAISLFLVAASIWGAFRPLAPGSR